MEVKSKWSKCSDKTEGDRLKEKRWGMEETLWRRETVNVEPPKGGG